MPAVAGRADGVTAASFDVEQILSLVRPSATSLVSTFHGEEQWRTLASIGLDLAARTPGCDPIVVVLFAVPHDAQRVGDDQDPPRGARGVALGRSLSNWAGSVSAASSWRSWKRPAEIAPAAG